MAKSQQELNAEIDQFITSNGTGNITGPVLNSVLKSIVGSLQSSSTFLFPKDTTLVSGDVGKLVMNDGSGTAKVYQLSEPSLAQPGIFLISINDLNDLNDNSAIDINSNTSSIFFNRVDWRNGITPVDVLEELNLIKDYIDNSLPILNFTVSIDNGKLKIEENSYDNLEVKLYDFPDFALSVQQESLPDLPAMPAFYPLGKLVGIQGDSAVISSAQIETYSYDGNKTLNNNYFNSLLSVNFQSVEDAMELLDFVAVPSANGTVTTVNAEELNFDNSFWKTFRHQPLGIVLNITPSDITVFNVPFISFLFTQYSKLLRAGIITNK